MPKFWDIYEVSYVLQTIMAILDYMKSWEDTREKKEK